MPPALQGAPASNVTQDFHRRVTITEPANATKSKENLRFGVPASRSCGNVIPHPSSGAAALLSLLDNIPAMELRKRFPKEATAHRAMLDRVKQGKRAVDERWRDLRTFLKDILADPAVGRHPGGTMSLDRINTHDPEYGPGKVRWLDKRGQSLNRRQTRMAAGPGGREVPICVLAKKRGLSPATVRQRLKRQWTEAEALSIAVGARRPATAVRSVEALPDTANGGARSSKGTSARLLDAAWGTWRTAWSDAFPHAPGPLPWGKRERGQMAQLLRKVELSGAEPLGFLRCAVTRWRGVLSGHLHWLAERPQFPEPGFLLRWMAQFFDTYAAEREAAASAQLRGDDRELARLLALGMTRREAETEMRCHKTVGQERAKREKASEHSARTIWALQRDLADATRRVAGLAAPVASPRLGQRHLLPISRAKHGSNPWENGGVGFEDLSLTIGPWRDEE